jgi:hypothetical protein
MVAFYVHRIRKGKMKIEEVPEKWRAEVEAALEN